MHKINPLYLPYHIGLGFFWWFAGKCSVNFRSLEKRFDIDSIEPQPF